MKKLLFIFVAIVSLNASFAQDGFGWEHFGTSYNEYATALFNRMTVEPSAVEKNYISSSIDVMINAGTWGKLDVFSIFTLIDSSNSLLNWIGDTNNPTNVNAIYIEQKGFKTDGSNYINTNYNPSVDSSKFNADTAAFGLFVWNDTIQTKLDFGARNSISPVTRTDLLIASTDGKSSYYINNNTLSLNGYSRNNGLFATTLCNDTMTIFRDGAYATYAVKTNKSVVNYPLFIGAYNLNGSSSLRASRIYSGYYIGGDVNEMDNMILYNTYMGWFELHDSLPIVRTDSMNIIAIGNSLTVGEVNNTGLNYTELLLDSLSVYEILNDTIWNMGTNGITTQGLIDTENNRVSEWSPDSKKQLAIVWEITNDIYYRVAAERSIDLLESFCKRLQYRGFDVAVMTAIPRGSTYYDGGTISDVNASLDSANALLISRYSGFSDYLIDLTNVIELSDYNDTDYYSDDKVHLKQQGYEVIAREVKNGIADFLNR